MKKGLKVEGVSKEKMKFEKTIQLKKYGFTSRLYKTNKYIYTLEFVFTY